MHYLSENEIASIANRLKEDRINYSHLFDDLLDHVCCDIEICMQKGHDYEQASQIILKRIGLNGLREIQEATIFYVKLNLIIMKKLMNVLAIIGTLGIVTGLVFKMNHWTGGSLLFFVGALFLFLGFFPTALLNIRKEQKLKFFSPEFAIYLVGFLTILVTGASILFTNMHWPYGKIIVLIEMVLMLFVFFPMLFYRILKSANNRVVNLALVIFTFLFVAVVNVHTYNSQISVINVIENVSLEKELSYYKKVVKDELLIKNNHQVVIKNEKLSLSLTDIETQIIKYQNAILGEKKNIFHVGRSFLHGSNLNSTYENDFKTLKTLLQTYRNEALSLCSNDELLKSYISEKLSTDPYDIELYSKISWEKRNFYGIGGDKQIYTRLNRILRDVYQIHYEVLRNFSDKEAPEL